MIVSSIIVYWVHPAQKHSGGGSGIRTHETREGLPDFKSGAFDHSAIPPDLLYYEAPLDTV